jgi:hypothetical protein
MRKLSIIVGILALSWLMGAAPTTKPAESLKGKSFQIQNADQTLLLRPRDASNKDGTPLVLYTPESWKCMTWKFEKSGDGYQLLNYFTHKTLQPEATATPDQTHETPVVQMPASKEAVETQQWKFIELGDGWYRIDNVKTGLTLGAGADGKVTTGKWADTPGQKWKLLPKPDPFTG